MSKGARAGLLVAAAAIAVAAFVLLRPSGDTPTTTTPAATAPAGPPVGATTTNPEPAVATIRVRGGEPQGAVKKLSFRKGEQIRFRVTSDEAELVHLHGYDVERPVGPGRPASFDVPATITGRFEAELENSAVQVAEVTVRP